MSTFHGLEMAKQALFTQQSALYTTGHNIANANTEGYSRQRVNFETLPAYPTGSRNRPQIPGQIGQGVQAGSVERIRDSFLDLQYRGENVKNGYWQTMSESLYRMESLLNEPSESGLANTMDKFWQSLQDLAVNPENNGARSVVAQRGLAVADTFNYLRNSLDTMQSDIRSQIDTTVDDVNSILKRVNEINDQIKRVEPHGYLPNDLYDERDVLIDELYGIVNIKVHKEKSAESSLDIADGLVRIELVDDSGSSFAKPINLVNPDSSPSYLELSLDKGDGVNNIKIDKDGENITFPVSVRNGSLSSLINVYGIKDENGVYTQETSFGAVRDNIILLAKGFSEAFNEVHRKGDDLQGNPGMAFFVVNGEGDLTVSPTIVESPGLIAASAEDGGTGNGQNALDLTEVFDSTKSLYEGLIGDLGVTAQEANRMAENTNVLRSQVEQQRMSVSSVSLDEEMSNMIKFQHAYNAAARSMTAVDEMLDRIINSMGLVGR